MYVYMYVQRYLEVGRYLTLPDLGMRREQLQKRLSPY
jgi:hypothetical protein